jgi:malic enzyme
LAGSFFGRRDYDAVLNILCLLKRSPFDFKVAVIGAGIAGASCARALAAAGISAHVVDKSRGAAQPDPSHPPPERTAP